MTFPRRAFLLFWLPPILWMTLIFIGSSDVLSAPHTSRFILPFLRWLLGSHFTLEKAAVIHLLVRKAGHLTEYAILASLLWRALGSVPVFFTRLSGELPNTTHRFLVALGLAALYAASDEFHQSFIPTRTASPVDVMIDSLGAFLALSAWLYFHQRRQLKFRQQPR